MDYQPYLLIKLTSWFWKKAPNNREEAPLAFF
jgi:hypothetical protein